MEEIHRCRLPDANLGNAPGGHVRVVCAECGRTWEADGWHPYEPPADPVLDPAAATSVLRLWPDPEHGPYRLRLWLRSVRGRLSIVGAELWGQEPVVADWPGPWAEMTADLPLAGISAEAGRLKIGELLDDAASVYQGAVMAAGQVWGHVPGQSARGAAVTEHLGLAQPGARRGRPPRGDEHYAEVAAVYKQAMATGRRAPAVAVADHFSKKLHREVPKSTARSWIRVAADRGLLPKGGPGRVRTEEEDE